MIPSYPLLIGGQDEVGQGWTYVPRMTEFLQHRDETFSRKRQLELGETPSADDGQGMAGRCTWGDKDENSRALEAAAQAFRVFRRFPLEHRREMLLKVFERLEARAAEFLDILVAEGHPRRLAEWEVAGILAGRDTRTVDWVASQMSYTFADGP